MARVLAISTAIGAELNASATTLAAFALSPSLDADDLGYFRRAAHSLLAGRPNWTNINLATPDGRQVVNLQMPPGASLPSIPDDGTLPRLTAGTQVAVGNMLVGPVTLVWDFAVRVPVIRDGRMKYVLSAVVQPSTLTRLVDQQRLPSDWMAMILDSGGRVVARNRDHEKAVGQFQPGLREALAERPSGWLQTLSLEGEDFEYYFQRLESTGWTFALGIPATVTAGVGWNAALLFALGLATTCALAMLLARTMARRISRPIVALAQSAQKMRAGASLGVPDTPVEELQLLGQALQESVEVIQQRTKLLEASEERVRMALTAGRMGVYEWDPIHRVTWWSPEVYSMHGVSRDSFDPAHAVKLTHPEDLQKVKDIPHAIEQHRPWVQEYRIIRPDGQVRWMASRGETEYDKDGEGRRFYGVIMDITERKKVEEALQDADRHKDEFLAMLSHELRSPLAALTSAAQVLRIATPGEAASLGARGVVERQTEQMVRLVEDLLEITRVKMGKLTLRRENFDLAELVSEIVRTWRMPGRLADQANVRLDASTVWIDADRARLEQVFSNLLHNALKFTRRGDPIDISVREEGGKAVLRVADTGRGIASESLARIFQPFVQAEHTMERSEGGLGLGLALVERLVSAHGGTVDAESEGLGRGCVFTVRLPAIPKPDHQPRPPTTHSELTAEMTVREHIGPMG